MMNTYRIEGEMSSVYYLDIKVADYPLRIS
jgi:hypothetical protein